MWDGGECWILGGGSSMPRQFGVPEDTIHDVKSQVSPISVYSDYMSELHDRHVIGVNIAFMLGKWISVLYFCDQSFFRIHREAICDFHNLKATCVNHINSDILRLARNVKRLKRDNRLGLSANTSTIQWNFNSGCAAINFAVHAGVKRINLLGFDMKPIDESTHWHSGFQGYENPTGKTNFKRFMKGIPYIAEAAKKRGVEILNINQDSAIEDFKKVSLKDVL